VGEGEEESTTKKPRILSGLVKKAGGLLGKVLSSSSPADELDFT
jgi:hypothetical protein